MFVIITKIKKIMEIEQHVERLMSRCIETPKSFTLPNFNNTTLSRRRLKTKEDLRLYLTRYAQDRRGLLAKYLDNHLISTAFY